MSENRKIGDAAPARHSPPADGVHKETAELREQLLERGRQADEQAMRHRLAGEELQHRARNTMALVRAAFKRTIDTGRSLEEIEMHFCGRLDVLAFYMLPRSGQWDAAVDVQNIIREELRNFQFGDAPGIMIKGPDVALAQQQAQSFALAVHELATNALKFGALSVPGAALNVSWKRRTDHLKLLWAETGVPIVVSAPFPKGFGQEFIEEALPYQTGAITQFEIRPGGVRCSIELPLSPPYIDGGF